MSNATLRQIRDGFCDIVLAAIDGTGNYITDLKSVNKFYQQGVAADLRKHLFPRTFLVLDSGTRERQAVGAQEDTYSFFVLFQCYRQGSVPDELEDAKLDFIEDLNTAVNANNTLGGLVQDVGLPQFVTDNGSTDPLGLVLFEVEVLELGR